MQAFKNHLKSSEDNFSDLESSFSSKNLEIFSSNTAPLKQQNHNDCLVQQNLAKTPDSSSNLLAKNEDEPNYAANNVDNSVDSYLHHETQNNSSLFRKSKSFENIGRILNVFHEGSQKSNKNTCENFQNSNEKTTLLKHFTTARLTPIEHKTKSALVC